MKLKSVLVVGGSNGIGLAMVKRLLCDGCEKIIVVDRDCPEIQDSRVYYEYVNLSSCDYEVFKNYQDIDALIITAGFGRSSSFDTFTLKEIENGFKVNTISPISIINQYYSKLLSKDDFYCAVMGSIAGLVSSPLFSVYSATKAAICRFIESVNIELEKSNSKNRILNISPGSLKGTKFNGGQNNIDLLNDVVTDIFEKLENRNELFIPEYDAVYKNVINRYNSDSHKFGLESYDYKMQSGRMNNKPQVKIGYLSGTFDLFHIGHLNLLRKAKEKCDYLVVGVHYSGAWKGKETFIPYEERVEIVKNIKYVDKVVMSEREDNDAWLKYNYDYLFVGSDYKGTERFNRYEEYFKDKGVEIIYFPYTKGTSSTQLREALSKK